VWEKTLENATAFINAGGWAVWSMVQFSWNEHQIETAMEMAKSMGFLHFHTIYSNRNVEHGVGTHVIGKKFFSKVEPLCLDRKRLFITARGNVFPCCWMASDYENLQTVPNIKNYDSLGELLQSKEWQIYWSGIKTWKDPLCRKKCGQNKRDYKVITPFSDKIYDQPEGSHVQKIKKIQ
jgi:MoaA/NifB/PqqE/SkfB family radical SAM enzyme